MPEVYSFCVRWNMLMTILDRSHGGIHAVATL